MMQKIQRFGGAMFTPVLLFAFAGIMIGVGTLFTTEAIMGSLASTESLWYQCWNIILQGGWTVFNQLPLIFVVGLPIGLAKKQQARCCMEALVLYLTFQYFLSTILSQWGTTFGVDFAAEAGGTSGLTMVANIKTLDMGMIGALMISGIVIFLHNRYFDTELPEISFLQFHIITFYHYTLNIQKRLEKKYGNFPYFLFTNFFNSSSFTR